MSDLDELTPAEVHHIIEDNESHELQILEAQTYAVKTALASILKGKDLKLFGDQNEGYQIVDPEVLKLEKESLINNIRERGGDI